VGADGLGGAGVDEERAVGAQCVGDPVLAGAEPLGTVAKKVPRSSPATTRVSTSGARAAAMTTSAPARVARRPASAGLGPVRKGRQSVLVCAGGPAGDAAYG
jgi:hypothetical protein